jgi:hypothetical protein
VTAAFYQKVSNGIDSEISHRDARNKTMTHRREQDEAKKELLVKEVNRLMGGVKITTPNIPHGANSIDEDNLIMSMEQTMVLHSNLIDDIFILRQTKDKIEVILNSIVTILHHQLKFQNQYQLKTVTEIDKYIVGDQHYNQVNIHLRNVDALIKKQEEHAKRISQKIGFLRDITKLQTQKMFREKDA